MANPAKPVRINLAMQVLKVSNQGTSISAACKQVGIPRSTFYAICDREPNLMRSIQDEIMETTREELAMVITTRVSMLNKTIQDGLADTISPMVRLAIYRELEKQLKTLISEVRLDCESPAAVEEILSGPVLHQSESRFTAYKQ